VQVINLLSLIDRKIRGHFAIPELESELTEDRVWRLKLVEGKDELLLGEAVKFTGHGLATLPFVIGDGILRVHGTVR
jgi:hypothetical protein